MSVKKFKFVSPGVFINEIDNSFIPRSPTDMGPVVIGRATTGLAMQPVKVEAYSDFVSMFGETVPGNAGGDVFRNGLNTQSPIYGTYAAKAFLNSGIAPLTYVRTLGGQAPDADTATGPFFNSEAGWRTENLRSDGQGGGAFGLFVWPSGSFANETGSYGAGVGGGTGSLACIWYLEAGLMMLSGGLLQSGTLQPARYNAALGTIYQSDDNGIFQADHLNGAGDQKVYDFSLDDTNSKFVRQTFNTNPQLMVSGNFYPTSSRETYWLGESYEQEVRDALGGNISRALYGAILPIELSSSNDISPANRLGSTCVAREAVAGYFIGQDTGLASDYNPAGTQKLFRLIGRGHGSWLNQNAKISIANIRQSNTSTTDYGTFSVLIRQMSDSDNALQILERFDELSLDPTSPNYIARKMGDRHLAWDDTEKRLKEYGEYPNQSKYVYVDMNGDVAAGATGLEKLLPFGYYGPPKWSDIPQVLVTTSSVTSVFNLTADGFVNLASGSTVPGCAFGNTFAISGNLDNNSTAKLTFPSVRLRNSASDGGITDPRKAFFGFSPTRSSGSAKYDPSCGNVQDLLSNQFAALADNSDVSLTGIDGFAYIFTLDNVTADASVTSTQMYYLSGARSEQLSYTAMSGGYVNLLDAGYDSFTAPFWGGFDGFNIKLPDPLYNKGMSAAATVKNSAAYYTLKRAIDTVADPEAVEMNLLAVPGLTNTSLTQQMIDVCEARADTMALIDLPDVYIPTAEEYKSSASERIGTTPQAAATALRDRGIDSSYGCTFYPWVQTRDATNGAAVWIPPSAAMLGVLASSQKKAQLWFAPAGFNRGGLSEGAAGIPVAAVTEKLTSKERDLLYEANINPIASFPSSGIVVFGQKTLQERQSALDRINVRRLVIYLKKQISVISTKILFEQNVQTTWNRFIGLVEPFLANVKSNFGISDYKLILDSSTTTPDLIDQNIMYAKIMVKPARSIEYIAIDFVVASTGASFDD
jgi:hypothetical protein